MFSNRSSTLVHASVNEDPLHGHRFEDFRCAHFACAYSIKAFFSYVPVLIDVPVYTIQPGILGQGQCLFPKAPGFARDAY